MTVYVVSYKHKRQWNTQAIFSTKEKALKDMKRRCKQPETPILEVGPEMWSMGENYLLEAWVVVS